MSSATFISGRKRLDAARPLLRVLPLLLCGLVWIAALGCGASDKPRKQSINPATASLLMRAQQAYTRADYETSLRFLDSVEAAQPDVPDLWYLRGVVLGALYRFDDSDAALEKAMALDPTYRSVRYNLGHNAFLQSSVFAKDAYRTALGHYRDEEALLRNALRAESARPADREALSKVLVQIGTTYARLNVPDSAQLAYEEAADVDSTNGEAFAYLATMQQASGKYDEALQNAAKAATIEPNVEHRLLVGVLLNELGRSDDALPYLEDAAGARPWDRTAAYNLGQVLSQLGHKEEGLRHLERADSLEQLRADIERAHMRIFKDPSDPIRWENYAFLLHQSGQMNEARKAIRVMQSLAQPDSASRPDPSDSASR